MASEYRQEDPRVLNAWNRMRDRLLPQAVDPHVVTQRGRLFLARRLTASQFDAANRWADMLERFDRIVLDKRRGPPSPAFERISPDTGDRADDLEAVAKFREEVNAARDALLSEGHAALIAVNRFCREEGVGAGWDNVVRGLRALEIHWRLTPAKKSA